MQQKNSVALFEPAQTDSSALWRQNNKKQADALNQFFFCSFLKKHKQNRGAYHHHNNNCQLMLLAV